MTTKHTKMCPTELHIGENTIKAAMKCLRKPCENSSHCFFSSQQTWAKKSCSCQSLYPLPLLEAVWNCLATMKNACPFLLKLNLQLLCAEKLCCRKGLIQKCLYLPEPQARSSPGEWIIKLRHI